MPAHAHVIAVGLSNGLNQDIQSWFRRFPSLPPLPLIADVVTTSRGPASLEHLLSLIAESGHSNFILIVHGYEDGSGLSLNLSHTRPSRTEAKTGHWHLQRLMDLDNPLIDLEKKEKDKLGLSDRTIDKLNALARRVREKKINCIEFRACNLGRNTESLERFRKFLGARRAGAPDLHSFFGEGPVVIGGKGPKSPAGHHHRNDVSWETYKFPNAHTSPNLVCCWKVNKKQKPEGGHMLADSAATVQVWVRKHLMPHGVFDGGKSLPIHGLWVTGRQIYLEAEDVDTPLGGWGGPAAVRRPIFPQSEMYRKHVIYRGG